MRLFAVALIGCLAAHAFAAPVPEKISDAEAAQMARTAVRSIEVAQAASKKAITEGNDGALVRLAADLDREAAKWHMDHLAYRALFPYSECPLALTGLSAQIKSRNDKTSYARDNFGKKYAADLAGCKKSIRKPDMSLKNIE